MSRGVRRDYEEIGRVFAYIDNNNVLSADQFFDWAARNRKDWAKMFEEDAGSAMIVKKYIIAKGKRG